MSDPIRKALKKINLLNQTVLLAKSAMRNQEPTDIAMESGLNKSQLSKLNSNKSYQVFVEMFYSLMYPYIMSHNLPVFGRFLNIIGIDLTFIRMMRFSSTFLPLLSNISAALFVI